MNALATIGPHPDGGGRYYGVTNEVETLLLAPTLAAAAVLGPLVALPALVLVGWSRAGADGGGLLVFAVALAVLRLRLSGRRLTPRLAALAVAAAVAIALVLVGIDAATGGASHVTDAVGSGPGSLAATSRTAGTCRGRARPRRPASSRCRWPGSAGSSSSCCSRRARRCSRRSRRGSSSRCSSTTRRRTCSPSAGSRARRCGRGSGSGRRRARTRSTSSSRGPRRLIVLADDPDFVPAADVPRSVRQQDRRDSFFDTEVSRWTTYGHSGRPTSPTSRPCGSQLAGSVVTPADDDWDEARQAWNLAVDQRPAAVALPRRAEDVGRRRRVRRQTGCGSRPQGTGHNAIALGDARRTRSCSRRRACAASRSTRRPRTRAPRPA